MSNPISLTGNEAAAWGVRLARTSLALSFPMGPNAEVTETLQKFIDNQEVAGMEVIYGDSEKSAMSMQIGAARLGVRTMLCVNSEGILWTMADAHYGAGSRLPMLMVCPSRALEPPTTVFCDHDDFVSQRDMGWLMFYASDCQDVLDTILQAYKISEDPDVMLPALVAYDGWEVSHASMPVVLPSAQAVDAFLPRPSFIGPGRDYLSVNWEERCHARRRVDGASALHFMEIRHHQRRAYDKALGVTERVGREYQKAVGGTNTGLIETHLTEDAEIVIVTMGVVYGAARFVTEALRAEGCKLGCVKLRAMRPFPGQALARALENARLVLTIDRNSFEAVHTELKSHLYGLHAAGHGRPPLVMGAVLGVGGWAIRLEDIGQMVRQAQECLRTGHTPENPVWHPLREFKYDPREENFAE